MFHFKKFSIEDSMAAMKIGTDAVLLGAWTVCNNETRILDVGTGTGILSLMLAQRTWETAIDALEIDADAAKLAMENILLSPWNDRINIFNIPFQEFAKHSQQKYSLIVCNPPFFAKSLKANSEARNLARHNDSLPVDVLLFGVANLLADEGKAAFIFPFDAIGKWQIEAAGNSLFPSRVTLVKSSPTCLPHRAMVEFTKAKKAEVMENEICIYNGKGSFSSEYQKLTSPYYLKF